jgi:hypothetical protein
MQYLVFICLMVASLLAVVPLSTAQPDELPPAPDAELDSVILFPDALFQGVLSPARTTARYVLYAERGDTINIDVQRFDGSSGTQATLFGDGGHELESATAEDLDNLILQHDVQETGWYGLDLAVNAAASSQYQMLLSGTSDAVYSFLDGYPEETDAVVLFTPISVRGGEYLVFVPASRILEISGENITLTELDGDDTSGGPPEFSPETNQWLIVSGSSEISLTFADGNALTPRDFLPRPPNIVVDGTILEVTLLGDPLDALSSASPGASVVGTLNWGDRVLYQNNKVNITGRIYLEVQLADGSTAYIPEGTQLYVERDPNAITEGVEIGAVIAITRDGDYSTLYAEPAATSDALAELRAGFQLTVIDGPVYDDYMVWWQLQMADGRIGWAPDIPGWWRLFTPTD